MRRFSLMRRRYRGGMTLPYRLHYAPDNASLIIRLALEEMGVPFETVLVDRARREQDSDAYRVLNPNGLIPVLGTPEGPIFETAAILLWLVDRHGRLGPGPDASERAVFLKWLFFLSNTVHPLMRQRFYPTVYVGDATDAQAALRRHATRSLVEKLHILDDAAQDTNLIAGDTPTVLDFYIACALRWSRLYPKDAPEPALFDLRLWPGLRDMVERLEQRQSVRAAIDAEGLGARPFTRPEYPNPPEGSAL